MTSKNLELLTSVEYEELVWSMKCSAEEKRLGVMAESSKTSMMTSARKVHSGIAAIRAQQTAILAAFVPDEIILHVNDYSSKHFSACVLCGDVSGFTDLCEIFNKVGKGGPSRLTRLLNDYIGSMVQEVMSYGGDVLKFSGDAFLAVWKCSEKNVMREMIHDTINCALVIQKKYGNYITDVGVTLRVKLAISAGNALFSLVGEPDTFSHYVVVGPPIKDVKEGGNISLAGDIIVAPSAWYYADINAYMVEDMPDSKFIKILGVGPHWRQSQRDASLTKLGSETSIGESDISSFESGSESLQQTKIDKGFSLRPVVNEACRQNMYAQLKKFIIPPVLKLVELNEPLDFLTEMRFVSVVLINIVPKRINLTNMVELVKRIYKNIVEKVERFHGCINKLSLFDKDIMIILLFGLRGFKQHLEAAMALKCSLHCFEEIQMMHHVKSVSIAVTSGKCYCGVFGHTLRREYTVISLTVNKAARMMIAYPDKVTCCDMTFINSKLKNSFFLQQVYKPLKGIKNPGPVYEFKAQINPFNFEQETRLTLKEKKIFPLLGRDEELDFYTKLTAQWFDNFKKIKKGLKVNGNYYKMLVIIGDPKFGKSRLCEEMLIITSQDMQVFNFLSKTSQKNEQFLFVRKIFKFGLNMTQESFASRELENVIQQYLKSPKYSHLLCALNDVFNVRFPITPEYLMLSKKKQLTCKGKLLQKFATQIFQDPVIVINDRSNDVDASSWTVTSYLMDTNALFFVHVLRPQKPQVQEAVDIFNLKSVKTITMKKIDNYFTAAIVCQLLDVRSISVDLEKVIIDKSNGNPGWIDNYLHYIQQINGIVIKESSYRSIHEAGQVVPPINLIRRLTTEQVELWEDAMHQKHIQGNDVNDMWTIFLDVTRGKSSNVDLREEINRLLNIDVKPRQCSIAPGFDVYKVEFETPKEIYTIKIFDSLTYSEQLTVKVSSVLGQTFTRNMLEYVAYSNTKFQIAKAVQKLFEINILGCARGDFTEAGDYVIIREKIKNRYEEAVECNCRGIEISEEYKDVPKYAFCGYMYFKAPEFLETAYNVLTEEQRKDFHYRAAKYLEKNTRKCRACGNGFFSEMTGLDKKRIVIRRKQSRGKSIQTIDSYTIDFDSLHGTVLGRSMISATSDEDSLTRSRSLHHRSSNAKSISVGESAYLAERKSKKMLPKHYYALEVITPMKLYKLKKSVSLTRTFSQHDFSNCECVLILYAMYNQIIKHYQGSGQSELMINSLISYSKNCIQASNFSEAFIAIKKVEAHLSTTAVNKQDPKWKRTVLEANVHVLKATCLFRDQMVTESLNLLYLAMKKFGLKFPKNNISLFIKRKSKRLKQKLALYLCPQFYYRKDVKSYQADYQIQVAECLLLMVSIFTELNKHKEMELAAIWALQYALIADQDFRTVCRCMTQMLIVAQINKNSFHCLALEIHALRYCHTKLYNVEADDIKYIAELYNQIRRVRLSRSDLDNAIYIGFLELRMSISVRYFKFTFKTIPLLIVTLLLKLNLQEAASLVHELEYYSTDLDDDNGLTWFHTTCIMFQLETGYTITPIEECEHFYLKMGIDTAIRGVSNEARGSFLTVLWLWYLRNERWEAASRYQKEIYSLAIITNSQYIFTNIRIYMYLLEGLLLKLVHLINILNISDRHALESTIHKFIKEMESVISFYKLNSPRLQHFKAYYEYITYNEAKAKTILEKALKEAHLYQQALEIMFVNHTKLEWDNALSPISRKFWKRHCEPDKIIDFRNVDPSDVKLGFFTLPSPKFEV